MTEFSNADRARICFLTALELRKLKWNDSALASVEKALEFDQQGEYYRLRAEILRALGKGGVLESMILSLNLRHDETYLYDCLWYAWELTSHIACIGLTDSVFKLGQKKIIIITGGYFLFGFIRAYGLAKRGLEEDQAELRVLVDKLQVYAESAERLHQREYEDPNNNCRETEAMACLLDIIENTEKVGVSSKGKPGISSVIQKLFPPEVKEKADRRNTKEI